MSDISTGELKQLIVLCKSELLNHALQREVASDHIRNINQNLDDCLDILDGTSSIQSLNTRNPRISGNNRDKALFFAYCMSKYDYPFLAAVTKKKLNQTEAFSYLASQLGVKPNTLKNYRDTFDPHLTQVRSNRQGWQKEITPIYQTVLDEYDSQSENQLIEHAKAILDGTE